MMTILKLADIPLSYSYLEQSNLIRLHLISDKLIGLSCFAISIILVYIARKRPDFAYSSLFSLLSALIFFYGITHFMAVFSLSYSFYWILGIIKAITALFAISIPICLIFISPKLLALPSIKTLKQEIKKREQIEQALRDSEARFRKIFLESPLGMAIVNLDYQIINVNHKLCEILGYTEAELTTLTFPDITHPDDIEKDLQLTEQLLNREIPYYCLEKRYITKQGKIIWGKLTAALLRDQKGQPLYGIGMVQDITEIKKIEDLLRENELKFRQLIENIEDVLYIHDTQTYQILYVNQAVESVWGITCEQVYQNPYAWIERVHPEDRERIELACEKAKENKSFYREEYRIIRPDGQIRWINDRSYFILDKTGQISRMAGIAEDITEQKEKEKQLELQDIIVKTMAEGICLISAKTGKFVYTNPKFEEMFGYDTGELIGKPVSVINYGDDSKDGEAIYQEIIQDLLAKGEHSYEVYNIKKDGTPFWGRGTASCFEHPDYGLVFVAVHEDIDQRKQAQDFMAASLQEKEVLLKEVYHRVKNNLQVICSLLNLQCRTLEEVQSKEILRESQNRVRSMAIIHEKLYQSQNLAKINLADYVDDLVKNISSSYQKKNGIINLKSDIDPNIFLDIDTGIICGLILNELISNALKYAFVKTTQGEIVVQAYLNNHQQLVLTVADNGQTLPKNFDLDTVNTLGLQLVKNLTHQLRGNIIIETNQGTKFKITFTPLNK